MRNIIVLLIVFTSCITAQKANLNVAGMNLQLGMDRSIIETLLPKQFSLTGDGNPYLAIYNAEEKMTYGILLFDEHKKLRSISKDWLLYRGDISGEEVMSKLFDFIKNAVGETNWLNVNIKVGEIVEPNFKSKSIKVILEKGWQLEMHIFIDNLQMTESIGYDNIDNLQNNKR